MRRPTIPDLAEAAGVSTSTVNRVIRDPEIVRKGTRERILQAAEEIGFYGLGSIEHSIRSTRETHRLGVLLQKIGQTFYNELGTAITAAAKAYPHGKVELTMEYADDLSPDKIAKQLIALGGKCESVALVAAQHPIVADAIDTVLQRGVPVAGLIAPLAARGNVGYIGLDSWKVGRTAAWTFNKIVKKPGKIGVLVGNHRYRNQELSESGFRSYFREHNQNFTLLEPQATYETAAVAREIVEGLLSDHPDLCGLFVSGGGITGAIAALRESPPREDFVGVGFELFDATRTALIDGTLTMTISHPVEIFAHKTIETLIRAKKAGPGAGAQRTVLDFDLQLSENV